MNRALQNKAKFIGLHDAKWKINNGIVKKKYKGGLRTNIKLIELL